MNKNVQKALVLPLCAVLVVLAEISSSTTSFFVLHEPDCPDELIK
jgi:cyclic lactone autoinducer peptide